MDYKIAGWLEWLEVGLGLFHLSADWSSNKSFNWENSKAIVG